MEEEPSARGAALLALESLGAIEDVGRVRTDKTAPYEPDPERHGAYVEIEMQRHRTPAAEPGPAQASPTGV